MCAWRLCVCVCVFPFICKFRLAAHELHIFFRGSEYFKFLMAINLFCNLSIHLQKVHRHGWLELLGQGVSSREGARPCNLCGAINRLAWGLLLSKQVLSCQKLRYILNSFIIRIWLLHMIYKSIC